MRRILRSINDAIPSWLPVALLIGFVAFASWQLSAQKAAATTTRDITSRITLATDAFDRARSIANVPSYIYNGAITNSRGDYECWFETPKGYCPWTKIECPRFTSIMGLKPGSKVHFTLIDEPGVEIRRLVESGKDLQTKKATFSFLEIKQN